MPDNLKLKITLGLFENLKRRLINVEAGIGRRTYKSRQVTVETTIATSLHAYRIGDRTRRTTRLFVYAALLVPYD